MTPVEIQVMIHWVYRCDRFPYRLPGSQALQPSHLDATIMLEKQGMIKQCSPHDKMLAEQAFEATEKGHAYVKALGLVQLPVQRWEVPK